MSIFTRYLQAAPISCLLFCAFHTVSAQVPQLINYQGRVIVTGTNFNGSGQFKFALVDGKSGVTYWSNDGTSVGGSQPANAVTLPVSNGLYSVALGDNSLANMTVVPYSVFGNNDVRLRVWFNDGAHGWQLFAPDQRIASVGYAMMANSVTSGCITSAMIASGAVGSSQLASNLTLGGAVGCTGDINLPVTSSASTGVLEIGSAPFLHAYGLGGIYDGNTFAGLFAGNFTMTGNENTANGFFSLNANTTGFGNTSNGCYALYSNTTGCGNTAGGGFALFANTTGTGNTASGFDALAANTTGCNNTATGYCALSDNTTGLNNTAAGYRSLWVNTTGSNNTAVGSQSLFANTTGSNNTACGLNALSANSMGSGNTAAGYYALNNNTFGYNNTAAGYRALALNTTGGDNAAMGDSALYNNTGGGDNIAIGYNALFANTTGACNTALGAEALMSNTTGEYNIGVGFGSGYSLTTGSNNIDIGNWGIASDSNTIRIGTYWTHTNTYIAGIRGVTAIGGIAVYVDNDGHLGTLTSSQRFKRDIQSMEDASDVILSLKPVTFRYKTEIDPRGMPQFGLVAEDVEKICPDLVARDEYGQAYTVRYEAVNAMLLNEFLKEHQRVEEQGKLLSDQETTIAEQQKMIRALSERLNQLDDRMGQISRKMDETESRGIPTPWEE